MTKYDLREQVARKCAVNFRIRMNRTTGQQVPPWSLMPEDMQREFRQEADRILELLHARPDGRNVVALAVLRDVLGIDYDRATGLWWVAGEPAPTEYATLQDALCALIAAEGKPEVLAEVSRRCEAVMGPWDTAPFMRRYARGRIRCVFCGEEALHDDDCPALVLRDIGAAPPRAGA